MIQQEQECMDVEIPTYETTTIIYLKGTLEYYNTHLIIDFLNYKYQPCTRSYARNCTNYSTDHRLSNDVFFYKIIRGDSTIYRCHGAI